MTVVNDDHMVMKRIKYKIIRFYAHSWTEFDAAFVNDHVVKCREIKNESRYFYAHS